jgi:hypothetical protein
MSCRRVVGSVGVSAGESEVVGDVQKARIARRERLLMNALTCDASRDRRPSYFFTLP